MFERQTRLGVIPELADSLPDVVALRDLRQHLLGQGVLGGQPGHDVGLIRLLQRSIRIVLQIRQIGNRRLGIIEASHAAVLSQYVMHCCVGHAPSYGAISRRDEPLGSGLARRGRPPLRGSPMACRQHETGDVLLVHHDRSDLNAVANLRSQIAAAVEQCTVIDAYLFVAGSEDHPVGADVFASVA